MPCRLLNVLFCNYRTALSTTLLCFVKLTFDIRFENADMCAYLELLILVAYLNALNF